MTSGHRKSAARRKNGSHPFTLFGLHMFQSFAKVALPLLLIAGCLSGCGGGEADDYFADTASVESKQYEFPARGPEWFAAPSDQAVANPG